MRNGPHKSGAGRRQARRVGTKQGMGHGGASPARNGEARQISLGTASLAQAQEFLGSIKTQAGVDLTEKVRDLLRLAKEQGHLTYDDVNEALPEELVTPEDLDHVHTKLRNLEIEVVDPADVDRNQADGEEEGEVGRLDFLDDPVRMYLKQMGRVPLLTREQEVEICKQIEDAEKEARQFVYSFGFAAKEHLAIAEKLLAMPPKERFDRVVIDKFAEN